MSLSHPWAGTDRSFAAPNAPDRCGGYGPGYEWFTLEGWIPGTSFSRFNSRIEEAAAKLKIKLKEDLKAKGLGWKDLILMGFSQGAILSLAIGLSEPESCAGIMAYSGAYLVPMPPVSKPPVLLVHGGADMVVTPDAYSEARKALEGFEVPLTAEFIPHCGHWIDPMGLDAGKRFLDSVA